MYEQMGRKVSGNLFDAPAASEGAAQELISPDGPPEADISPSSAAKSGSATSETEAEPAAVQPDGAARDMAEPERKQEPAGKKQVVQVMVFYDDDTFRTFRPAH